MYDELDPERERRLLDAVSRLPRSVEPARDAWPAIRDRIEAHRVRPLASRTRGDRSPPAMRFLAAAVLLMVASSAATILVSCAWNGRRSVAAQPDAATPGEAGPGRVPPAVPPPSPPGPRVT